MKKRKCVICEKNRAGRICGLHDNKMICSLCCAEIRNSACEDCHYFKTATQYLSSKTKKTAIKPFIAEINEEVENAVDQALGLVEKGDIKKGWAIINDLRKDYPRNHMVHFGMGVIHAFSGENDEAIKCFDKAIAIFPYLIEAHFNKGVAYKKKLDVANTIKAFKEVIAIGSPEDSMVKQAKDFIEGMEENVLETNGVDLETYLGCNEIFNRAFSYMEKQEWQKAIDGFKACLIKNKRHPQSYGNMGLCYTQLGQKEEALLAFDKALEIDPAYEPAIVNRVAVESLEEGEKLESSKLDSIDYYKDFSLKKRSYLKYTLQKIMGK